MNRKEFLKSCVGGLALAAMAAKVRVVDFRLSSAKVLVGNYLVTAPTGIAFIVNDEAAFVMDFAGVNERPGLAAPDDSFHQVEGDVTIEWGRTGDAIVARMTCSEPTNVRIRLSRESWPGFISRFASANSGVTGEADLKDGRKLTWRLETRPRPLSVTETEVSLAVAPNAPAHFVAGLGGLPSFDTVDDLLTTAKNRYLARRPVAAGDWDDFVGAIAENLNNSRIYSSDDRVVAHTVSRAWAEGKPNNAPLFCWDSFFNGLLASLDDPRTGRQTIRSILSWAAPQGFVPNFAHWDRNPSRYPNRICSVRSQPPVGALCVWKMHQRWPGLDFLQEVYPKLAKWHAWWFAARDGNHDGLLEWGSDGQDAFEANYETGWDDTPAFEGAKMAGNTLNANAVDLNSLYTMDAEYLALIADALGARDDALAYRRERTAMIRRINDRLWNEELGVYCSRYWDEGGKPGAFLTRLTPMNFYPLIAGAADQPRAERVLKLMTDPKKFWGRWVIPTLPYDDPLWPKQDYWRGKVWAPVNYLVFQGLKRYASPELQAEFARKSVEIFMRNWTARRVCGENFLSTTGDQSSDPHYTWGALMCLVGLESIVDLDNDGRIKTGRGLKENLELNNIPIGGQLRRISVANGRVDVQPQPKSKLLGRLFPIPESYRTGIQAPEILCEFPLPGYFQRGIVE